MAIALITLNSCSKEIESVHKASIDKESKYQALEIKLHDFVSYLRSGGVEARTETTYDAEELEIVVEGALNWLHAKPWLRDAEADYFRDTIPLENILAEGNTEEDAAALYTSLRQHFHGLIETSERPNKRSSILDLDIFYRDGGYHLGYALKVCSDQVETLASRTTCTLNDTLYHAIDDFYDILDCAYENTVETPSPGNCVWAIQSLTYQYSQDIGAWYFECYLSGSSPLCSLYYTSPGVLNSTGQALFEFDNSEANNQRTIIETDALDYGNFSTFHLTDLDGEPDYYSSVGNYHFWQFHYMRARWGAECPEPEPPGDDM